MPYRVKLRWVVPFLALLFSLGSSAQAPIIPVNLPGLGQFTERTASQSKLEVRPCRDSSFYKRLFREQRADVLYTSKKTSDGGVVVAGSTRTITEGPPYTIYGWIAKFDSQGNSVWATEIRGNVRAMNFQTIGELADGSLVVSGLYNNAHTQYSGYTDYYDAVIVKVTASGTLSWLRTYHSQTTPCNNTSPYFNAIEEGSDGALLLTGRFTVCLGTYLSVVKLGADGSLLWGRSFKDFSNESEGIGIYQQGNEVIVIGKAGTYSGSVDGLIKIIFMRMNYHTGAWQDIPATWKEASPSALNAFWRSFMSTAHCTQLTNGGYLIYGRLFGDMDVSRDTMQHFGVLEFDSRFNFVDGYTIQSRIPSNYNLDVIKADRSGRVAFSITPVEYPWTRTYLGTIHKGQFTSQRKITYALGLYGEPAHELTDDGGTLFLRTAGSATNPEFMEYLKTYDSDTSSGACLGQRETFAFIRPLRYVPYSMSWQGINYPALVETTHDGVLQQLYTHSVTEPCHRKSFCDTLKIRGDKSICNGGQEVVYTAFKNPACGSWVTWNIAPEAVELLEPLNDSTVKVRFKGSWQGYLYARIEGSCEVLVDSLGITVQPSPGPVTLGSDTTLCAGNTLVLNARRGYASYRWPDGSADSTFRVTGPGTYYVETTDACGGVYRDTVVVSAAPPVPLDLGPDRSKCNGDTVQLHAPAGFLDYRWSNDYHLSSTTAQSVVMNPLVDTAYYLRAEKTPGCFAYDTVRVKVYTSPPIHLGRDTSFCRGQQVTLDAGPGFAAYSWSTGASTRQITVQDKGTYSVAGTTAEGCRSQDTLQVVAVHAVPVVDLGSNPTLCTGAERVLDAGTFATYLWQDGSTGRTLRISEPGSYSVRVTNNNGCTAADTLVVDRLLPLPKDFLPADTAICQYGTLVLKPVASFTSYAWSNGSSASSLTVDRPGRYQLEVTDGNGCTGKDEVVVNPKECLRGLHVPNAFTPNKDGKNDLLRALLFGVVKQYQFTVYNRWGEVVFQTTDPFKGWDGTYRGKSQDTNVFVWTCRYQLEGEEEKQEKGTVVVIR